MRSARLYADNASAMWTSLVPAVQASAGLVRIESPTSTRMILREPMPTPAIVKLIDATPAVKRTIVEDVFGAGPQLSGPLQVLRMPVMIRPAAQVPVVVPPNVRVAAVAEADELAEAERVVVDGFPLPIYQPWTRGQVLPPHVLRLPGWRVWLAYRDGLPAAAGYTYDDGVAVGVYWLATLPEHRLLGLGRAIMTVSMAAHPGRTFTLVATDAGLALYESLGFATVAMSTWYVRSHPRISKVAFCGLDRLPPALIRRGCPVRKGMVERRCLACAMSHVNRYSVSAARGGHRQRGRAA